MVALYECDAHYLNKILIEQVKMNNKLDKIMSFLAELMPPVVEVKPTPVVGIAKPEEVKKLLNKLEPKAEEEKKPQKRRKRNAKKK